MTEQDALNVAKNFSHVTKYSTTIYRDFDNNWCFMNTGVAENCWPEDIYDVVGILLYEDENYRFLKADKMSSWNSEDLELVAHMTLPSVAKEEYEKRSHMDPPSRFTWPV